ncbi:uncharacterized protein [Asterias amurensis]|uniref:uncharacterized protein isoform X2 n=1 Tax=Asterias amurensis TaxID=7602 RepID=UPI003AB18563
MTMSFKFHQEGLSKLCRICSCRIKVSLQSSRAKAKNASEYVKEIFQIYGISTWQDTADQHPSKLCEKCARKLRHQRDGTRNYSETTLTQTQHIQKEWPVHIRTGNCFICNLITQQSKGGSSTHSRKNCGRPKQAETELTILPFSCDQENIFNHLVDGQETVDIPNTLDIIGHKWEESLFTCPICLSILGTPSLQTHCQHNYCAKCLSLCFKYGGSATLSCPVCSQPANYSEITLIPRVLKVQLQNLDVVCTRCGGIGQISKFIKHECKAHSTINKCTSKQPNTEHNNDSQQGNLNPSSAAKLLKELASKHQVGSPLPQDIEEATDKWVWLKLHYAKTGTAKIKTAGRPAHIQKVTIPSKSSDSVCKSYKRQRTAVISTFRETVSKGSTQTQQADEVQALTDEETSKILQYAKCASMTTEMALSMMRDCHLAWEQLRKLRRYIGASSNVKLCSERQLRKKRDSLLQDNIRGELVQVLINSSAAEGMNGLETKDVPFVYVNNLSSMILDYLDRLDSQRLLTWYDGLIPDNEIWLKVGGDKGGNSFKMCFQIVNVNKPNSLENTVVFACYEGTDSLVNLQRTMPAMMEQIALLSTKKWRERSFRLLCFGDYELLNKLYGINGCNARYCCIYCTLSKEQMQTPFTERSCSQLRTLDSIRAQFELFTEDGSKRSRSKDVSFSVVREPMMPIEPDHVVLPSLHISLGVFKKLFDLYESACHELDLKLFKLRYEHDEVDTDAARSNFETQIDAEIKHQIDKKIQLTEKQNQLEQLEEDLPLYILQHETNKVDEQFIQMAHERFRLRAEIQEKETETDVRLSYASGPVTSALDKVLQKFKVQRQAYHGKSFVGNHVHKCCKPDVIEALTAVPRQKVEENLSDDIPLSAHDQLLRQAATTGSNFRQIFLMFADVHHGINHSNSLDTADIHRIDLCIKEFMQTYRTMFPSHNVTPKLHLLEDHAVKQLMKFKVGFGLLNEQGGELIHTEFNRTGRVVQGMRNDLQRLISIMKRHHTSTAPEVRANIVKPWRKHEN